MYHSSISHYDVRNQGIDADWVYRHAYEELGYAVVMIQCKENQTKRADASMDTLSSVAFITSRAIGRVVSCRPPRGRRVLSSTYRVRWGDIAPLHSGSAAGTVLGQ